MNLNNNKPVEDVKYFDLIKHLEQIDDLPTLPVITQNLIYKTNNPDFDIEQVTGLIEKDPAITVKILRIANSAFYSGASEINTIKKAIMRLGIKQVRNILLGISVIKAFSPVDEFVSSFQDLWSHSIGVAFTNMIVAEILEFENNEELWICGILHDLGKVVYLSYFPEIYSFLKNDMVQRSYSFYQSETENFNFSHTDIGSWLANKWNIPKRIRDVISNHHNPPSGVNKFGESSFPIAITNISNSLVKIADIGNKDFCNSAEISPNIWNYIDKSKIEGKEMQEKIKKLKPEVDELFSLIISSK
ncbi:MAG: HDOD domain-containing protein [Candidatus Muiribacteriota bacterium]